MDAETAIGINCLQTSLHFLILFQVVLSNASPMLCSYERQVESSA